MTSYSELMASAIPDDPSDNHTSQMVVSEPGSPPAVPQSDPQQPKPSITFSSVDAPPTNPSFTTTRAVKQPKHHTSQTPNSPSSEDPPGRFGTTSPKNKKRVLETVIEEKTTKKTQIITEGEPAMDNMINILIVFANPKDSDSLRLHDEQRTIEECIRRSKNRDDLTYKIIPAARTKDVHRGLIEDEYQIVHFSGHGAPDGQLALEDETGMTKLIPQQALANLLGEFSSIECVILNSCYTVSQGEAIALGVPSVIAMDGAISDASAQHFTRGFYDSIGAGRDYWFAYKMGCSAIAMEEYSEELLPKYFGKRPK